MVKPALLALLAALMFVPASSAVQSISLSMTDEPLMVSPTGSAEVPFSVALDCDLFLSSGSASLPVTVSTELPSWFGAVDATVSASPTGCTSPGTGGLTTTVTGNVIVSPTAAAFGYMPYAPKFTATAGSATDEVTFESFFQVDYAEGHTIAPSISFPHNATAAELEAGKVVFDVDVAVQANSRTMVMFMEIVTDKGSVSGLKHIIFEVEQAHLDETLNVTASLPKGDWESMSISFRNFSHCLKGTDCPELLEEHYNWTIVNPNPTTGSSGDGGSKESPSLPFVMLLAVVASGFLLRRRSA